MIKNYMAGPPLPGLLKLRRYLIASSALRFPGRGAAYDASRFRKTDSSEIAAGVIPGIRAAWPRE